MRAAIKVYHAGGKLFSQVCKEFGIARRTLKYKYEGKRPLDIKKPGPSAVLGKHPTHQIDIFKYKF